MSQSSSEELIVVDQPNETDQSENEEPIVDPDTLVVDDPEDLENALNSHIGGNYEFKHIYNGMIVFPDGEYYGLIEFKIISPKVRCGNFEYEMRFTLPEHKCSWFLVDGDRRCLVGPLHFDSDRFIKEKRRFVRFQVKENYPEFSEIVNIDNTPENMIRSEDLPDWMLGTLVRSVGIFKLEISRSEL